MASKNPHKIGARQMGKKLPRTRVLGRITSAGVELELYAQPTQNVWWKYRQKKSPTANHAS